MQTNCFEIDTDGRPVRAEFADVVTRWRVGSGLFWIDLESEGPRAPAEALAEIGLERELIEELLETGHAARILPLDAGLYFEFPLRVSGHPPEVKSISVLCLDRLLVTLHPVPLGARGLDDAWLSRLTMGEPTMVELISVLLTEWSVDLRRRSSEVRAVMVALSDRLDREPEAVEVDEILELNRQIVDMDAISEEREAVLQALVSIKWPLFDATGDREPLRLALSNTSAISRRADRFERRARDLQSRYDSIQQEKTNRRLSRLTVISAIFLPLTLIAGVYGMNFEVMPELHHPLGYPVLLSVMAVIAVGLFWWFRSRGWMN